MLRSVGIVLLGYLVMAVIVVVSTAGLVRLLAPQAAHPEPGHPASSYVGANLAAGLLAALTGGWVVARLAERAPIGHGLALAALVAVMGLISARQQGAKQPAWYRVVMPLIGAAGSVLGAYIAAPRP